MTKAINQLDRFPRQFDQGEGEGEVSQVSQDPNLNFDQSEVKFIRG